MSSPVQLVMFVQNAGKTAPKPGQAVNTVNFALPPKSDRIDDDNGAVFAAATPRGGATITLSGLANEAFDKLPSGARVRVTFEVIE